MLRSQCSLHHFLFRGVTQMTEKIFIGGNDMAIFKCPVCKKSKTVNVSSYKSKKTAVNVKCKCPCGHTYSALLERRKHIRKDIHLSGSYMNKNGGDRGRMEILDLSRSGLRIKINTSTEIKIGDILKLQFTLDDKQNSEVTKEVIVRSISGNSFGTEFLSLEHYDKLGSYLLFDFAS